MKAERWSNPGQSYICIHISTPAWHDDLHHLQQVIPVLQEGVSASSASGMYLSQTPGPGRHGGHPRRRHRAG